MAEIKTEKIEREYTIPLRREIHKVARYRKTEKAIKAIKEFLVRHMKIYDRDLKKIKIDQYLNEEMWHRGIRNPPTKVKVRAIKENGIVRVELVELPNKLKFKKAREEKIEEKSREKKKKRTEEKPVSTAEETKLETEEQKKEKDEKKASAVEAGQKMAEQQHKQEKHLISGKQKGPKRQRERRMTSAE